MSIIIDVKPAKEPVSLAFVKSQLNITHDNDDILLTSYISVAREHVEGLLNLSLISQTWDYSIDVFADVMKIPKAPLLSVTSIQYIDENGVTQTLTSTEYDIDVGVTPGLIRLAYDKSWPAIRDTPNAITIKFVSGYGANASDVPFRLRQAIALFVGHLEQNREATSLMTVKEVPMAFDSLISNYRWRFL